MFQNGHTRLKSLDISLESQLLSRVCDPNLVTTIDISHSQNVTINGSPVLLRKTINRDDSNQILESHKLNDCVELCKTQGEAEIDESNVNFNQNREQWQRRANSQTIPATQSQTLKANRHSESYLRQNHTPDLVMDLPLVGSSSPKELTKKSISVSNNLNSEAQVEDDNTSVKSLESPQSLDSPDMQTAAERFAKQNQCTLKKNTKVHVDNSELSTECITITSPMLERKYATVSTSTTTTFKPQLKVKPPVLKKPAFSVPLSTVPADILLKDQSDLPT